MEDLSKTPSAGHTRRHALKLGAVAGVGLLSMPLPASAIASSGASGEGGGGPTPYWSLQNLSVADYGDGLSSFVVNVFYEDYGLATGTQNWFVRFYTVDNGNYSLAADGSTGNNGSGGAPVVSGTFNGTGSSSVFIIEAEHYFVSGTYAARIFVNKSSTVDDTQYEVQTTGAFA